jgi:hypothetical protein
MTRTDRDVSSLGPLLQLARLVVLIDVLLLQFAWSAAAVRSACNIDCNGRPSVFR